MIRPRVSLDIESDSDEFIFFPYASKYLLLLSMILLLCQ